MLAMTSDYVKGTGDPSPYLARIAQAGFSHVHWCHQWCTDFIYARPEIEQVAAWLRQFGLRLRDLHGSVGPEKDWACEEEYRRRAGVDLVQNRLEMTAALGGSVVIMHAGVAAAAGGRWDALRRSLDELGPVARGCGVRIAVENGDWATIRAILAGYGPGYAGLCYDSGHGNIDGVGLAGLDSMKDRLIAVHLHDNDGAEDEHRLPFSGTIDWAKLMETIARSSYDEDISLESAMRREGIADEGEFLATARVAGLRLSAMLAEGRSKR